MSVIDISKLDLNKESFAVIAEKEGYGNTVLLTDLTFGRLLDEVVVPYENNEDFFIDGVPCNKKVLRRVKIILCSEGMKSSFHDLFWHMRRTNPGQKLFNSEEYRIRIDAILRESGTDITSQVVTAYQRTIKDRVKDWVPKREELISGAWKVFIEAAKLFIASKI